MQVNRPAKRAAIGSVNLISLDSDPKEVLDFLGNVLTAKQYQEVLDRWEEEELEPTGAEILQCDLTKLRDTLRIPPLIASKLDQHLKLARVPATGLDELMDDAHEEDGAPVAAANTPLVEATASAPQEVDLATAGLTTLPKRRGRPAKAKHQPRLSERLDNPINIQADDDEEEEEQQEEEEADEIEGRRTTRHRRSRLAAVQRAEARVREIDDTFEENPDEETESESEDEEEVVVVAAPRRRRGRAAVEEVVEEEEEEEDTRPEEPDDGINPMQDDKVKWEDQAREGLEDILRMMTFDELKHIVDENDWNVREFYRYTSKNRQGVSSTKNRSPPFIAGKITKMLMDNQLRGGEGEAGGTTWDGVDAFLTQFVDESYITRYLDNILKLQFATPPKISDTRKLLWRLWSRPRPPTTNDAVVLGTVTLPVVHLGSTVRQYWTDVVERWDIDDIQPWIATPRVNGALKRGAKVAAAAAAGGSGGAGASGHQQQQEQRQHIKPEPGMEPEEYNDEEVGDNSGALNVKMEGGGDEEERENIRAAIIGGGVDVDDVQGQLVLADAEADGGHDWSDLAEQLINLQGRGVAVRWRLELTPTSSSSSSSSGTSNAVGSWLRGEIIINMKDLGERRIHTAFLSKDSASQETYLVQIWLDKILQAMDHLQDSQEFLNRDVERLNVLWDKALDACERQGVETTLEYPQEVNIRMYDRIMMGVENLDRPMLEGIEEECNEKIALKLKPYQKRALSFMMREEKAEGGTARLLWLKVPLPGNPVGVECWMSPSLFQIYISKSPTVTNLALGNTGGGGWQALEMGMGKTAVIIAGILFNPPPTTWRAPRPWKAYSSEDYYSTVTENMPRGGTLVIVPTTLVRQWELEIEKTLDNPVELSVLRWTDGHRSLNCNALAGYDVVITTPQMVSKSSTLCSIYWHRVVIDEAQLNAGSLMKSGLLFSTNRWIVSGTPCNAQISSLEPSLDFLRLGGYGDAQRFIPPALATVLQAVMVRYTMQGTIDGETNLKLPEPKQKVLGCHLLEEDAVVEREKGFQAFCAFRKSIKAGMTRAGLLAGNTIEDVLADPNTLRTMIANGNIKRTNMKHLVQGMRGLVGGGKHYKSQNEQDLVYNEVTGEYDAATIFFQSKAQAVAASLEKVRREDPDAKILVFSEFEESLKSIARLLPDMGLDYRAIYGSTSSRKRGEAIEAFMNDPPTRIFLLVAKSGAVGVTLTAASHVFICEPLMNPALEKQAIGRSNRMGQTKQVIVSRLYVKNTIEERVRKLLNRTHGPRMLSTAAAANEAALEIDCKITDYNELLKCEDPNEDEEEEGAAMQA